MSLLATKLDDKQDTSATNDSSTRQVDYSMLDLLNFLFHGQEYPYFNIDITKVDRKIANLEKFTSNCKKDTQLVFIQSAFIDQHKAEKIYIKDRP